MNGDFCPTHTQFCRKKTDLCPVESQSYIKKNVLLNLKTIAATPIRMASYCSNKQKITKKKDCHLPICDNKCPKFSHSTSTESKVHQIQQTEIEEQKPITSILTKRVGSQYENIQLEQEPVIQEQKYRTSILIENCKIYSLGERASGYKTPTGGIQVFQTLFETNLDRKTLFEDPEFPPDDLSLFKTKNILEQDIQWLRPHEICSNPKFIDEKSSLKDLRQGDLSDSFIISAITALAMYPSYFNFVVPTEQEFENAYAGIFHFRIWQYGVWLDVIVDDRLPTINGKPIYSYSKKQNEFWCPLLEKAYAKLRGSYESLSSDNVGEALEDFTGGVSEIFYLNDSPTNLFKILLKSHERRAIIACSTHLNLRTRLGIKTDGLVEGQVYVVTKLISVPLQNVDTQLVRLRDPWGKVGWNGPWSCSSTEWKQFSDEEKIDLGLTFDVDDDSELWMNFRDFYLNFKQVEVCNISPISLRDFLSKETTPMLQMINFEGEWVKGITAGGCSNFQDSYPGNPQFLLKLTEPDDSEGNCTVIIALMQKPKKQTLTEPQEFFFKSLFVYLISNPKDTPKPLDKLFFTYNKMILPPQQFLNKREIVLRINLLPGSYCIIPTTLEPNQESEFLLRIFTEGNSEAVEYDQEIGYGERDSQIAAKVDQYIYEISELRSKGSDTVTKSNSEFKIFRQIAGDNYGIDWMELQLVLRKILKEADGFTGFSKDVCRALVSMMDTNRSGLLELSEFMQLLELLRTWTLVWSEHDIDKSGTLNGFELRTALESAGYKVNNKLLNSLMHRYGSRPGELCFEDFLLCAIKLKTMIDIFMDKSKDGEALFTIGEWLEISMYS